MKERGMIFNGESEIWKPVVGYEGRYEVSNLGNVRSLSNYRKGLFHNNIAHFIQNKGYHYVSIRDADGKSKRLAVHRIVLEAFVGPRPDGKQIAHWNGDPSDNRVENLRWATSKENIADRSRHGRTAIGENAGSAKLDRKAVKTIKRLNNLGLSACEVAHLACVNPSTIISIWQGESWKHA
ncbi:NUMOD4 motif-containing HNH endonuclease [Klebsiella pasteurii]|uniref:NUMOD4 motif-containing HNH endonuclease n=1 Tax=Klebsiella pasteurii TaxID=2587529 RepID=UPI0025997DA5|nr:NUMOD4 motif-containing HNH endonuclease [Klebsiella pasteurii]MDM4221800.1 NUMOD4 motif-containing HNH endonuclease [Klebsiella pasteurii]